MLPSCLDQDYVISCLGTVHSTLAATSYDEANVHFQEVQFSGNPSDVMQHQPHSQVLTWNEATVKVW